MFSLNCERECENCFHVDFFIRFFMKLLTKDTFYHSIHYKDHYTCTIFLLSQEVRYLCKKQENTLS